MAQGPRAVGMATLAFALLELRCAECQAGIGQESTLSLDYA